MAHPVKAHSTRARSLIVASAVAASVAAIVAPARAQVATLNKGHTFVVNNGLQIWGLDQGASTFNYNNLAGEGFSVPRYLFLVVVPSDVNLFAEVDETSMRLSHCGY